MADVKGLLTPGNIDIHSRPVVQNQDGSISTVRSISVGTDQGEVLIPTVVGNRVVSNDEAIAEYKRTGKHLGIFDNPEDADAFAQSLHEQQAQEYAGKPVTSPFVQQQESPFGPDASVTAEATTNDNVPTPSRTGTMALALIQQSHQAAVDDLSSTLQDAMAQADKIISSGQETNSRMQAVVAGTRERMQGLQGVIGTNDPHTGQLFTPDLIRNVQQTTAADRANRMDDLSHSALEEQAVHAIQDKLAAGDEVGARALYNRLDPNKNSSFGVMRDFYTRNLMIANAVEKAGLDENEQSIFHKVLTTVLTLPESFLLKTMRENTGLMKDGKDGYHSSFLRTVFDPGGELGKQVLAFQSMDKDQQAKYLPTLINNIKSETSQFGLSDPGKAAEVLSMFKTGVDSWQRAGIDAGNALDVAMIAPMFKVGGGLAHISDVMTGMGARAAATNRVANAFEIAAKEGLPSMTQKTAVVPDELIQQGLPKSINPLLMPEVKTTTKADLLSSAAKLNPDFVPKNIESVSRAGDVADQVAYAREVLNAPEFQMITSPNRFFSPEERQVAIQSTVDTIKARTNSNVLDYEPRTVRLSNGQEVTQLEVTLNKPFASEDEALNWLRNQGYGADPSNAVLRGGEAKAAATEAPAAAAPHAEVQLPPEIHEVVEQHLAPEDHQVIAEAYNEPELTEVAKTKFFSDVRSYISGKLQNVGSKLHAVIKKTITAFAAMGVVFNPAGVAKLSAADAAVMNGVKIVRMAELPAGVAMSDAASQTYRVMAPLAKDTGKGFFIADKPNGKLYVFDHEGKHIATSNALYGKSAGDDLKLAGVRGGQTPAGQYEVRFENSDYKGGKLARFYAPGSKDTMSAGGVAIHSVYLGNPAENRLGRLATESVGDNKISHGCINSTEETFVNQIVPNAKELDGGLAFVIPEHSGDAGNYFKAGVTEGSSKPLSPHPVPEEDPAIFNDKPSARGQTKKRGETPDPEPEEPMPLAGQEPPVEVVQDSSGQFFPRVKMFVRETGFYTNDLNPPKQHFAARWLGTPFTTSDYRLASKGTQAGQVQQQWMREIKDLNKTVTKLTPTDRTYLREVIQRGVNESRWLSPVEFDGIWERATGKLPNDKVKASYFNYRTANDIDFEMRNANALADLATRGVEKVRFNALGKDVDKLGIVEHDLKVPDEPMLETGTGVTHKPGDLTEARLKELEGEGHLIVHTEEPVSLPDGTQVRKFLVKKGELESNQLPEYVLPYSEGGHRVYADKFFVKQAKYITTADNVKRLDKPQVFATGATKADVANWARTMEDARLAVRDGKDAAYLDQSVFKGKRGLPTGEDFMKGLSDGTWSTELPFEAVFDRELPTEYAKSGGNFADESGANGFYRTNGQLYYSAKGDALRNVSGELSPTIDPFKMQNNALFNVARLSSFDDFKTSSVNRWVNTYGQFLEYKQGASPAEIFNQATVSRGATRDLVHQIEGQREAIRRMLNFRGSFDMERDNALRRLHEWMVGDTDNELRKWISKAPLWVMDHNPVNMLRGLTFDMKLGMFNPGQLFVQVSTAFSAIAMSPGAGLRGLATIPAMIAYRTALKNGVADNVLDLLAKRGIGKMSGFATEQEFKDYMKFLDKSGIFAFGDSHLLVNTSHPAAAYSFLSKQDAVRTAGRFFFNRAEDANRLVAARIAYDEAVKKFGSADFKNFEFNEFFRARTENYSFNMSQTSAAAWQKGLLSIPTQFWAYNWRMMEALAGKQFTNAQKARLVTAQLFMAGTAGVPVAGIITDYVNNRITGSAPRLSANSSDPRGQPGAGEQAWAIVQRGMVDELVHLTTGADVQIGQRLGTGDFFQQTAEKLMGYSEYGSTVTPADMLGGATYSVFGEAMGSAFGLVQHWAAAETGGGDPYEMTQNDWDTLFKQVSSINNIAFKAYFAKQYGIYTSQKGKVLIDNLPKADAAFFALGFAPGELRDRSAMMEWKKNRQQMEQNAADFINSRWQESVREPDKFDQNARIVSQFVNMLPPEYKMDVLRQAHLGRDPSDYSRLLRIRQSTQTSDTAIQQLDEQFNSPDNTQMNEVQENTNG